MINISTAAVVTAQDRSDHDRAVHRDSTQTRIPLQKASNRFPIVTFGNVETFDAVPKVDRRVVILDAKLSGLNLHRAGILTRTASNQRTAFRDYFFAFRGSSDGFT